MPNFRLTLAYDGTDFCGSQVQPKQRTVQGELERVLGRIAGAPVRATFGGRTDRGVHAVGQIAVIGLPAWRNGATALQRALNASLPRDLAATGVDECQESFNPRFDATWRAYRYWVAPAVTSPFLGRVAWTPRADIDAEAVAAGARWFVGTHDFATFAGGGEGVPWSDRAHRPRGTTRTVYFCECRELSVRPGPSLDRLDRVVEIGVTADAFLPRMVRNIVGSLVEVGQGRQSPEWIGELLSRRDRRYGSTLAPPHGLTLHRIGFAGDPLVGW
ncbi:MAG: tRNA pseudouridine(38-40) synthase TruA [Thermomicrobiales bacterium]